MWILFCALGLFLILALGLSYYYWRQRKYKEIKARQIREHTKPHASKSAVTHGCEAPENIKRSSKISAKNLPHTHDIQNT